MSAVVRRRIAILAVIASAVVFATAGRVQMPPSPWRKGVRSPIRPRTEGQTRYRLVIYSVTPGLWRWECRCGGALLRCGTGKTKLAAEAAAKQSILPADVP